MVNRLLAAMQLLLNDLLTSLIFLCIYPFDAWVSETGSLMQIFCSSRFRTLYNHGRYNSAFADKDRSVTGSGPSSTASTNLSMVAWEMVTFFNSGQFASVCDAFE